jgi:hypothetical protein
LLAEVEVAGEREKAINQGFRILAGYIFGGNTVKQKIAMTTPVTQTDAQTSVQSDVQTAGPTNMKIAMTTPVTQTAVGAVAAEAPVGEVTAGQRWRVTFMMPSEFTMESLPTPNDKRIKFVIEPGKKLAAIKFDGLSTVSNLTNHRTQLEAFVKERSLKTSGAYTVAYYNDPFTLPWNRRNEWWVAVE